MHPHTTLAHEDSFTTDITTNGHGYNSLGY